MKKTIALTLSILIFVTAANVISGQQSLWMSERGLGDEQLSKKNYAEAAKHYLACVKDNKNADDCHTRRGTALLALGETYFARANFQMAVKINPQNKEAVDALAKLNAPPQITAEAINRQSANTTTQMRRQMDKVSKSQKEVENAAKSSATKPRIKALTAKIAAAPKNDNLYVERAKLYLENKHFYLAEQDAEKALKINPKNKTAQELRVRAGDLQLAFEKSFYDSFLLPFYDSLSETSQKESSDKPQAPKTEEQWKEICRPFWGKMYDALKKKDVETAKQIYAEFDATTKDYNGSIRVKVSRDSLLHDMYFSLLPPLKDFVENEMKRLRYTEKEKEEVKRDTSKGFYV